MSHSHLTDVEFDAEFFAEQPDRSWRLRLEDLSGPDANQPSGRGCETAAPRGYDTERLAQRVENGERVSASWFDVQHDSEGHHLFECKLCIAKYPNGQTGRFKLWRDHHRKLLGSTNEYPDTCGFYFFVIYTVVDGSVREIGKLVISSTIVEALIDTWHQHHHPTMGQAYAKQLRWTRLLSALNFDIETLQQNDLLYEVDSDQAKELRAQVDHEIRRRNPFEDVDDPYPVCGPSCEINHDDRVS